MESSEGLGNFWGEFWDKTLEESKQTTNTFYDKPVTSQVFFQDWIKCPLFPRQQLIVDNTFNTDYTELSTLYNEFVVAFGKAGGKDLTIANLITYMVYWLEHLKDPQEYLGLKSGEPIDIVNVAFDKEQAESVFFEKLKRTVRNTKNPTTGQNYFESIGMSLSHDILKDSMLFPKNIRAWSLNSQTFKSEGKNTIIAVFDEIGSFRFDRATDIYRHIRTTARTRCIKLYKLFFISFLTSGNDFMAYLIDKAEKGTSKNTYFDRAATWDVRSLDNCPEELKKFVVKKEDYKDDYDNDPVTATLMYECKIPKFNSNNFIKRPEKILACANMERPDPRIDTTNIWVTNLMEEELEGWFKPFYTYEAYKLEKEYEKTPSETIKSLIQFEKEKHLNSEYYVHLDLSRGVVDTASLCLLHKYHILEKTKIYVDFIIQVRAVKNEGEEAQELDIETMLNFVLKLKKEMKFPIVKLTADGWNSALFLNICNKNNIPAEILSLERDNAPYNTLKDFIYRGDIDFYYYLPLIRELTELIMTDKKKIDHPSKSQWRLKDEGLSHGSKDCSDSVAGATGSAMKEDDSEPLGYSTR